MPPILHITGALGGGGGGGSGTSVTVTRTYAGVVAVGDAVYQDAAGDVQAADASALATGRVIGVVSAVDSPGVGQCQVVLLGDQAGYAGLTPGATYILGTSPGSIVEETDTGNPNYPSGAGAVIEVVGVALTAAILTVAPSGTPIVL